MKTGRRPRKRGLTLEEEERLDKTILSIGALCNIDHSDDWKTNEKRVRDAKEALFELWQMAGFLIEPSNTEKGPTFREVKHFNDSLKEILFFNPDFPGKRDLKLRLSALLEKGIDAAELREILFWDLTEFRTVILHALHARGETLIDKSVEMHDGSR
jgi:hypothetical protein